MSDKKKLVPDQTVCSTTSAQSDYGLWYSHTWRFNSLVYNNHLSKTIYKRKNEKKKKKKKKKKKILAPQEDCNDHGQLLPMNI